MGTPLKSHERKVSSIGELLSLAIRIKTIFTVACPRDTARGAALAANHLG